jgi:hypothetical protein
MILTPLSTRIRLGRQAVSKRSVKALAEVALA